MELIIGLILGHVIYKIVNYFRKYELVVTQDIGEPNEPKIKFIDTFKEL